MSDHEIPFPLFVAVVIVIACLSWSMSASTIAKECEKLGGFYVGHQVYECKVKP